MNAAISGRLGLAFVIDDLQCYCFTRKFDEEDPRQPWEFECLSAGAKDMIFYENVDDSTVRKRLELESSKARALHYALAVLDCELSQSLRMRIAEELNGLDARALDYVKNVLFSQVLPPDADLSVSNAIGAHGGPDRVSELYKSIRHYQPHIAFVHHSWESLTLPFEVRSATERILVQEGAFRLLAEKSYSHSACRSAFESLQNWSMPQGGPRHHRSSRKVGASFSNFYFLPLWNGQPTLYV